MAARVIAMLAAALGAACGDDAGAVSLVPDGAVDVDAACPTQCDPLAPAGQQGCNTGQKCAALTRPSQPASCDVAAIGCVPAGYLAIGEACTWWPEGADDCVAGAICVVGTCRDVCGFGGGASEACAHGLTCARLPGLFENRDGTAYYGACRRPAAAGIPGVAAAHRPGP